MDKIYTQYKAHIDAASEETGLPRELITAVIRQESGGDPAIRSKAGAQGLMQLMPGTAKEMKVTNVNDPAQNILAGTRYLKRQIDASDGDIDTGLAKYNWGGGNYAKFGPDKMPAETRGYVAKVNGYWGGKKGGVVAGAGSTPLTTSGGIVTDAKTATLANSLNTSGMQTPNDDVASSRAVRESEAAIDRAAVQKQAAIGDAGWGESISNAWSHTMTDNIAEMVGLGRREDPNFVMTEELGERMTAAGVKGNKYAWDHLNASTSLAQFDERLAEFTEQEEYNKRLANTVGIKKSAIMATSVGVMLADPAMIAAAITIGKGTAALQLGRVAGVVAGMVGDVGLGYAATKLDGREYTAGDAVFDATLGGVFAGVGYGLSARADTRALAAAGDNIKAAREAGDVPMEATTARTSQPIQSVQEEAAALSARPRGVAGAAEETLSPNAGAEIVRAEEADPLANLPASELSPQDALARMVTRRAEFAARPGIADKLGAKAETDPRERGLPLLSEDPMYAKLVSNGVVGEVDSLEDAVRLSPLLKKQGIPADAKAMYLPELDKVVIVRGAVEPGTDVRGLVLHEVGVHYGLERSVGSERFQQLGKAVRESTTAEAIAARNSVPADTPKWLRDEEAIGYLVEKHGDIGWVRTLISNIKNALRDTFPVFGRMGITDADVIAYVKAATKKAANARYKTKDIDDGLVWHASPVAGLDALDTSFAKVGPNNSFFGWGNYVSSDRAVSEEYLLERIAQARAQGVDVSEGAMYRLRIKADKEAMITWEREVSSSKAGQLLEGTPLAALKGETGREYLGRIEAMYQGDQIAAANALWDAGVPGIRHATGYSRNMKDRYDSNYVLFNNDALDMAVRYSRTGEVAATGPELTPETLRLGLKAARIRDDLLNAPEVVAVGREELVANVTKWVEKNTVGMVDDVRDAFEAMGTTGARSGSKIVRVLMSKLTEDPIGVVKSRDETAAMYQLRLAGEAKAKFGPAMREAILDLMDDTEMANTLRLGYTPQEAVDRANRAVQLELALRRDAALTGRGYVPVDAKAAKVADVHDRAYAFVLEDAKQSGTTLAHKLTAKTAVGMTDYRWSRSTLKGWQATQPEKWNAFVSNLKGQYLRDTLRPAIDALIAKGHTEVDAMRAMEDRAQYLVANKIGGILDDNTGFDYSRLSFTAKELLSDLQASGFKGQALSDKFQTDLEDVLTDRSRHEMRLAEEVDGVRLMDAMDFDPEASMYSAINTHAGQSALARTVGIKDEEDLAQYMAVVRDSAGASTKDLQVVQVVMHQLGYTQPNMPNHSPWLNALQTFTSAAQLGKRVFSTLGDASAIAIHNGGMTGLVKTGVQMFSGDTELVKQMQGLDLDLVGEGWKADTVNSQVTAANMIQKVGTVQRMAKSGQRLNTMVSLHRTVYSRMRKATLNVAMADIAGHIARNEHTPRMADLGITPEHMAQIRREWKGIENYKVGQAIPLADRAQALVPGMLSSGMEQVIRNALTRRIDKAMPNNRAVGEASLVEFRTADGNAQSDIVAALMQYSQGPIAAHQKALVNGVAGFRDAEALAGAFIAITVGYPLYVARVEAATMGMGDEEAEKYKEKALSNMAVVQGVINTSSSFGLASEGVSLAGLLMGGSPQGSSSVHMASVGYAVNLTKAVPQVISAANPLSDTPLGDVAEGIKVLPGGTSLPATLLFNYMQKNGD